MKKTKEKMVSIVVCSICKKNKKTTLRRIKETKGYICTDCFKALPTTYLQHRFLRERFEEEKRQQELMKKPKESLIIKPTTNELINVSTGARI